MTTAEHTHSTVVQFPTKRKRAAAPAHGLKPEDDPMRVLIMSMLMLMPPQARQDILQMTMQRPWERPSERTAAPSQAYDILNQIQWSNWNGVRRED